MSSRRQRRSIPGALARFMSALVVLAAVLFGIPALLVLLSRLGLDTTHPFPAIGTTDEIRGYLDRELSTTEITPIAIRALLIVAWLLWVGMVVSIVASLLDARGARSSRALPKLAVFGGLGRWIAAGLTTFSAITPSFVSAAKLESPRPFTVSSNVTAALVQTERPVPAGFARVQAGESAETFAQRTLGDATRWPEIWELNRNETVGPAGAAWNEAHRLRAGWDLKLPAADAGATSARESVLARFLHSVDPADDTSAAPGATAVVEHTARPGDSYWSIAEAQLGGTASGSEIYTQVQALMELNAPRLGYADPAMLQPGDAISLVAVTSADAPDTVWAPAAVDQVVVAEGDSYWAIAEEALGPDATTLEVLELTEDLIDLNHPLLQAADVDGHGNYDEDRRMIHPGDVVYLSDPAATPTPAPAPTPLPPPPAGVLPAEVPVTPDVGHLADGGIVAHDATVVAPAPAAPAPPPAPVDETDDSTVVSPMRAVLGLSALATAGAFGVVAARRRRASRGRPHQRPAPIPEHLHAAMEALSYADPSDVVWLGLELRWLVHQCAPALRASLLVEEIQVGADRDVEIAFAATPLDEPPAGWTMVAERIWKLDRPHTIEELAAFAEMPPLLPCLVTLGRFDGGLLYCNLENHPGANVTGDPVAVSEWVTSAVWEVAGGGFAEHPAVLLVDVDVAGVDSLEGVRRVTSSVGLAHFAGDQPPPPDRGLLDLRSNAYEGWDTTLVVLGAGVVDDEWSEIAARRNVGVVAVDGALPGGLTVSLVDDKVSIPRWNLTVDAVALSPRDANRVGELLDAVDAAPVPDDFEIPVITTGTPLPATDEQPGDSEPDSDLAAASGDVEWRPRSWSVMVRLLGGVPRAEDADGNDLRLNPQPLAALAYIALHGKVSLDDLRNAIWSDGRTVKPHRLRDLLSELRKQLGGSSIVSHIEDGMVGAGDKLACDVALFEAHAERARTFPHEVGTRLAEMIDLVGGAPFGYPSSARLYWRWVDVGHLQSVWGHRIATAAYELAELHLAHDDPNKALAIAERGLQADPLNSGLTEMVMTCFARLGAVDSARRVFEQHERLLNEFDLGGASDETRRVLESLVVANSGLGDESSSADSTAIAG